MSGPVRRPAATTPPIAKPKPLKRLRRPASRFLPLWITSAVLLLVGAAATRAEPRAPAQQPQVQPSPAPGSTLDSTAAAQPQTVVVPPPPTQQQPADMSAAQRARIAREEAQGATLAQRAVSVLGLAAMVGIAWLLSMNRAAIRWRIVAWGVALQLIFGVLVLRTQAGNWIFTELNDVFTALIGYTLAGASFIFGNLVYNNVPVGPGGSAFPPMDPVGTTTGWAATGAFFAFQVLPTIIFFSSLMTLLYYLGVMQIFVRGFAWVMQRTMHTSGAETLSTAGNIFLGQTEAPLLVKPFVKTMTNSELHAIMVGGFATTAGGVLAAYVGMLIVFFPDIAGHLIAASVMAAPATLAISKIMVPETEVPVTSGTSEIPMEKTDANVIDATARGASEGLFLALNVGAMLLAFIALLALLNGMLGWIGGWIGFPDISIQLFLGWIGAPLAWLMGTPWEDAMAVGVLLGEKTALNEFVAYLHLAQMLQEGQELSPRAIVIASYALCGFANFSSIAIQIGGIGTMAPERRGDLSRLGLRAMIAGTLASFMTAAVAGILI
jgi:CNT family concentrative nucleoside transporter